MDVEWKKDMHHSYLLLKKEGENSYCVDMLRNNAIKGLIRPNLKIIDNQCIFSYETTALQSVSNIIEKLQGDDLEGMLFDLMEILGEGKEYLLNEDDYILDPEYMFYSLTKSELKLCYLDGYHKSAKEQFRSLMEYLMGKINHKDRDNVILVYGLYQISTDENSTFQDLVHYMNTYREEEKEKWKEIEGKEREPEKEEDGNGNDGEWGGGVENAYDMNKTRRAVEDNAKAGDPFMRLNGERMNLQGVLILMTAFLVVPIGLIYLFQSDWSRVKLTGGLDLQKVGIALLAAVFIEGYLLSRLKVIHWIKDKSGLSEKGAYQEGGYEYKGNGTEDRMEDEGNAVDGRESIYEEKDVEWLDESQGTGGYVWESEVTDKEGDDEPCGNTVVLKEEVQVKRYVLRPDERETYQDIDIIEFPFFIGKLKAKADGVIENKWISRYHAKIHRENDEFFLTDLASTNGTFLNGERLVTNERRRLHINDEVGFANVTYRFIWESSYK